MPMKTISNNNLSGNILIPTLIVCAFLLAGFFLLKKTQRMERVNIFSQEMTIDTVSDSRALGYAGQRKIVKDGLGNIFIGYRKDYKKNAEIFVAEVSSNSNVLHLSGTEKPIAVVGQNNDQRVPSLAVDAKNTVHAVWYGSDTPNAKNNRQVKYTRRTSASGKWEGWRNIAYVSGYDDDEYWQEHPMLLAGKKGTLYVVWEGKDEQNKKQQIKFAKSDNAGTIWSKWKNIEPTKNNTQSRPTMIEDGSGNLFLFMYSSQGTENDLQQIQYASSSDKGETWTPWQLISDPAFDARHISATVDDTGKIHVAWRAKTSQDGPAQIIYRTFSANRWSDNLTVFPSGNFQFFPSIGVTNSGIVYVTWMENTDASEFPRENPAGGTGLVAFIKNGKFQTPQALSAQNGVLYPNVSEKTDDENIIPFLYAQTKSDNQFELRLKFLDGTKSKK
jgi:hypothetical protein